MASRQSLVPMKDDTLDKMVLPCYRASAGADVLSTSDTH